jgi:hypothetical protein
MRRLQWKKGAFAALSVLLLLGFGASHAGTVETLQNTSFESYDPSTMTPDSWQVLDGNMSIYMDQHYDGWMSAYTRGGQRIGGVNTPNATQTGTFAQLVDLSTLPEWGAANWLTVGLSAYYRLWGGSKVSMYLEYLPASYNEQAVTVDDPAWSGADVITALSNSGTNHARSSMPWSQITRTGIYIPAVRWARARFVLDATYKSNSYFTDGPYYIALDAVSLNAEVVVPEACSADNLLANAGFESVTSGAPSDWHVLSGRMTAIASDTLPAYVGDGYAGNIGGYAAKDETGTLIDYPDPPQNGSLVQVVDLSTLPDWQSADSVLFNFSGSWLKYYIKNISATVEYLPESYNDATVAWDDPAWSGADVRTAVSLTLATAVRWNQFKTNQGHMPKVRWVRVRLDVVNSARDASHPGGEYLGAFDEVCFTAQSVTYGDLVKNPSFEDHDENYSPLEWSQDAQDGAVRLVEDGGAYDGSLWLAKHQEDPGSPGRMYQVIDLANNIPGWTGIDPSTGLTKEQLFIQFDLSAYVKNLGGSTVAVGLEYLPYSYNSVEGVAWNDPAWRTRNWTSNGTTLTNSGGDAIDLGALIEDTTITADPPWRQKTYTGWLPRVRWIRLRIELDATASSGATPPVGIDSVSLSASCKDYGPYSGYGYLPEATYPESADAIDKPLPGWVGPEGDGVCGGYTGQSQSNYINPAFAGFADSVASYNPSGQNIYNVMFMDPQAIIGRPFTDASWVYVIVTMGDMDLPMLADYFGPTPGGTYHPGEITAAFNESPIMNGPGHDFATFENGFVEGWTSSKIFAELAYVEVSTNGVDFIRMPNHSLTHQWPGAYGTILATGVFGITGKHVNAYGDSWGTPFDLDWIADHPLVLNGSVDLMNIRYVKQVDIPGGGPNDARGAKTGLFYDNMGNPIYDSWVTWGSGGADLDAVAVINSSADDDDGDHITNYWDNCSQTANDNQFDTDGDSYGNMCDCDIDGDSGGDGVVNMADYIVFRAAFGSHGPVRIAGAPGEDDEYVAASENWNPDADFNGDYYVDMADYAIFKERYGTTASDFR